MPIKQDFFGNPAQSVFGDSMKPRLSLTLLCIFQLPDSALFVASLPPSSVCLASVTTGRA